MSQDPMVEGLSWMYLIVAIAAFIKGFLNEKARQKRG